MCLSMSGDAWLVWDLIVPENDVACMVQRKTSSNE